MLQKLSELEIITKLIKSTSSGDITWKISNMNKKNGGPVYYIYQQKVTSNKTVVFSLKSDVSGSIRDSYLMISYRIDNPYRLINIQKIKLDVYPTLITLLRMVEMKSRKI